MYKIHPSNVLFLKTGDFKDADIVASLLDSICKELIRVTILVAQVNGLEKVYLAGNFFNNDKVRRIISRDIIIFSVKQKQVLH